MLTQEQLKTKFTYDPDTGFFRRKLKSGRPPANAVAGSACQGYVRIRVYGKRYLAHRLAFMYMDGFMPEGQVDHIDHNRANNKFNNLRVVTHSENQRNRAPNKKNRSGYIGVSFDNKSGKWVGRACINGKKRSAGSYDCRHKAGAAVKSLRAGHGYHDNHGK